jgi:hypothetical protein
VIKRVVLGVIAISAIATAVGVALVAAAFALYASMVADLGPPGAAAAVAGVAALLVATLGLIVALRAQGRPRPQAEPSLMDTIGNIARERPMLAAGGALLAGLIALKNPKLAAGLASAFLAGKAADKAGDPPRRRW